MGSGTVRGSAPKQLGGDWETFANCVSCSIGRDGWVEVSTQSDLSVELPLERVGPQAEIHSSELSFRLRSVGNILAVVVGCQEAELRKNRAARVTVGE